MQKFLFQREKVEEHQSVLRLRRNTETILSIRYVKTSAVSTIYKRNQSYSS